MKIKDICTSVTDGSHNPPQGIEKSEYMMLSSKNIFDDEIKKGFLKEDSKESIKIILATVDGMYYHSLILSNYNLRKTVTDYLIQTTNQLKK